MCLLYPVQMLAIFKEMAATLCNLQRHLGSGTQLRTFVQIEGFHLFHPYLQ